MYTTILKLKLVPTGTSRKYQLLLLC